MTVPMWRGIGLSAERREELRALARRSRQVVVLSALTGVTVGAAIAAFDGITDGALFARLVAAPLAVKAAAPLVGLVLAALTVRYVAGNASPVTADEYIKNFHDRDRRLDAKPGPGRVLASILTLGFGGALGYEGPSIYIGALIGTGLQRRFRRSFSADDVKLLMVAGAAAGVAAIFKAPATGAVFALEVPYQDDLARRMLLPALVGSATSYVTFVSFAGTRPLLPITGTAPFNLRDLAGAALVGLLAGSGARVFARVLMWAKGLRARTNPLALAVAAGLVLSGLALASNAIYDDALSLGPGYRTLQWSLAPDRTLPLLLLLFVIRAAATTATLGGGGAGGLFIPLVVQGAVLGSMVGRAFGVSTTTLFPVIGVAAFLAAGYRVPLAAVMFVAEFTGRPGFVVPGLIAAVCAELMMGRTSVSPYQVTTRPRGGHLENRFLLPITTALQTDVLVARPDTTVDELFWQHLIGGRQRTIAVVDEDRFVGLVRLAAVASLPQDRWPEVHVREIVDTSVPVGRPSWLLRDALAAMEHDGLDRIAVCDADDRFVGMVSSHEILKLDDILAEATGEDHQVGAPAPPE